MICRENRYAGIVVSANASNYIINGAFSGTHLVSSPAPLAQNNGILFISGGSGTAAIVTSNNFQGNTNNVAGSPSGASVMTNNLV